ncbi:MAG TPA: transcription antitermination factor NusB [Planctomycetota bacterium]|nr:transcription antitermination factor NusB [Planctomycetota bacterium]
MTHPHTVGRELALQYLYMHDILDGKDVQSYEAFIKCHLPPPTQESVEFAKELVDSVVQHREELDSEIAAVAMNWNIKRMSAVDRNVLRLGLAELTVHPDTSHKIILNEAVELAKRFSSEEAGAFVNGLLDKLRSKLRPEPTA